MTLRAIGLVVFSLVHFCPTLMTHMAQSQSRFLHATPEIVESWKDMRFGMFLCWGPVSLTGKEIGWSRGEPAGGRRPDMRGGKGPTPIEVYDNLYKKWKPDKFDAEHWVQIAKDAGMKYLIFLVKHHDGFCLYDSELTDFKITGAESAWKVDVMKHVADACHKHELKLMIYYSQPDWHHPDYLSEHHDRYIGNLHRESLILEFASVTGRQVRLNILEATEGPSIWEFRLENSNKTKGVDDSLN